MAALSPAAPTLPIDPMMPWQSRARVNFFDLKWLPQSLLTRIGIRGDRGVQYRAIRYGRALAEEDAVASVGSKGDSYDNAFAEALNSLYKAELIRAKGPWKGIDDVEIATAEWVYWFSTYRPHGALGGATPAAFRSEYFNALPRAV